MAVTKVNGYFFNGQSFSTSNENVAVEVPLRIAVNSIPFTVTMQTPGNEFNLIKGLLYTENIFRENDDFLVFEHVEKDEKGFITSVNVKIPPHLVIKDFAGNRNVISSSSCGICGKIDLGTETPIPFSNHENIATEIIPLIFEKLNKNQSQFLQTGGTHAAAAFTLNGDLITIQEDIGRHNAVDKVIGSLISHKELNRSKILAVSGRISYEIISKAHSAGISFLAAVSAPSSLSIEFAEKTGITLMAFCRENKFTIYTNQQKVILSDQINNNKCIKTA